MSTNIKEAFKMKEVEGLKISNNGTNPSFQVDIASGSCHNDDGDAIIDVASTLTADITASGKDGLDTGSEAASTWYAVHVIADSSGTNAPASLLSLSGTAPTLPSGYDDFRRLGWVRNDASSDFLDFQQTGSGRVRKIWWMEENGIVQVLSEGSATSPTAIDLSSLMPSTSEDVMLEVGFETGSGGAATDQLRFRPTGSALTAGPYRLQVGTVISSKLVTHIEMPTDSSQSIDYNLGNSNNKANVYVQGYVDQL